MDLENTLADTIRQFIIEMAQQIVDFTGNYKRINRRLGGVNLYVEMIKAPEVDTI